MNKKVFISYAWGETRHQDWVADLATRLMNDTIDVELDRWSLKDGHDIHEFMESMVKSPDIFRVLIICDKNYKTKSDDRSGGVGTETQIITPAIYGDQKQEKFIPIVVEKDTEGKPYIPVYLTSRKYIDFANDEYFESSYEDLLRNILEAPSLPKPKRGTVVPLYITQSPTNNSELNSTVKVLENQLARTPEKVNSYFIDFVNNFLEIMWDFELNSKSGDIKTFGEELQNNLLSFKILRDNFIDCLLIVTKEDFKLDVDNLIDFFSKAPRYHKPREQQGSWRPSNYENFKIIFQELFLYTISVCIKNKNYTLAGDLLHSKYYLSDDYEREPVKRFTYLYNYHEMLEDYYSTIHNKITGFGHYIISNLNNKILKEDIILADMICHYIGDLFTTGSYQDSWFPTTSLYRDEYKNFEFFKRLSSKRYFDKVKPIFDVNTHGELKQLLEAYKLKKSGIQRFRYGRGSFNSIAYIFEVIDMDTLAEDR